MQNFIAEGHDVLSSNHSVHMEELKTGKYAYIVDLTAAQYFISENCDYDIAPEQFLPLQYAIALQLNSAYTEEVTQL